MRKTDKKWEKWEKKRKKKKRKMKKNKKWEKNEKNKKKWKNEKKQKKNDEKMRKMKKYEQYEKRWTGWKSWKRWTGWKRWKRWKHPCSTGSAVQTLSHLVRLIRTILTICTSRTIEFAPNFLRVYSQDFVFCMCARKPVTLFEISSIFLLAVCSVAIRLVHAKVNLFLSLKMDHFGNFFPSVGLAAIFTTGYTLYFMSAVLCAFSIVVRVPSFKRTVWSQRGRLCFRVKCRWSARWYVSSSTLFAKGCLLRSSSWWAPPWRCSCSVSRFPFA